MARPSDDEIARELRDHMALDAQELASAGMNPRDAELYARRRFGNAAAIQEDTRASWGGLWLERLEQDLRFGVRMLRRTPVFTAVAILSLALGIGANMAVLGWTEGIVRHPFPGVRDQDRLVAVAGTAKGTEGYVGTSWLDFMDVARGTTAFSAFFVSKITGASITGGDRSQRAVGQLVTANFFDAIGVRPLLGPGFLPGEDVGRNAHPIVVISYRLWQDRFAGRPSTVGATINFDGVPHTIVGVTPEGFLGTFVGYAMQFWVPASQQGVFDPSGYKLEDRSARWIEGFGRLAPGVTIEAGQSQIDAITRRLESAYPNDDRGHGIKILPLSQNPFDGAKLLKPVLRIGQVVAILVLLIVCANVANLLLVRALARRPELTVRRALGAGRGRLTRQLVTEGLLLAIAGTVVGVLIAYLARNALGLFFAPRGGVTLVFASDLNWRVLSAAVATGVGSTALFALAPALQAGRVDLTEAMRAAAPGAGGSGNRGRLRASLVLVQVSLGVVLLIGAGLVTRSLGRLLGADPGFSMTNVLMTGVNLFDAGYDSARARRFDDEFLARTRAIPTVRAAALASSIPFSTRPYDNGAIAVDGYEPSRDEQPTADLNAVTPGYFEALGIPLLSGRDFASSDADTSARVAIVSRAMADHYWPNASPIGKRLRLRDTWMQVVGVAGDIKYRSLAEQPAMLFYVPLAQRPSTSAALFVRTTRATTAGVATAVTAAMHALDPGLSPYEFVSMREQVNRWTSGQRITVTLLMIFGGVALFLAAMGLYGVISYTVSQSTRELGLRLALGAAPSQLLLLVVSSGLRLTMVGVVLGVGIALGTTRLLGDLLFRIGPRDPAAFGVAISVMLVAAGLACLVPAWRASRLDPMRALRV